MTQDQIDGITKARLLCNMDRTQEEQFANNESYMSWVTEMAGLEEFPQRAADSYVIQHADKTISELEILLTERLAELANT